MGKQASLQEMASEEQRLMRQQKWLAEQAELAALRSKLAAAVAALEWYADYRNYQCLFNEDRDDYDSEIDDDSGNRARQALAEIRGNDGNV